MKSIIILILCCSMHATLAQNECCQNNSTLVRGGCSDGRNVTLECKFKYLLNPNTDDSEAFVMTEDFSLQNGEKTKVAQDQYCIGSIAETDLPVALVCFPDDSSTNVVLSVKCICTIISIVFLALTIATYCILPKLRDLQGKCILNSIIGLEVAFIILTMVQFLNNPKQHYCMVLAFTMYFAFLVAFFWLNIIAFHMWKTTVFPQKEINTQRMFLSYCAYGYGMPVLLLLISLIAQHVNGEHVKPGFGTLSCWFAGWKETWFYFYGPVAFLLIVNCGFFIWTSLKLRTELKEYNQQKMKHMRYKLCLYAKLFFVMGLTWIFEVLSYLCENKHPVLDLVWVITDFINALQGVLIFVILVVLRKRVLRALADKELCGLQFPKSWKTMQDEECIENDEEEMQLSGR